MSAEANARRVVPEARARELLNLRSTTLPGFLVRDTGDLRKHMTAAEVRAVTLYWQGLPGSASFASALGRLARPMTKSERLADILKRGGVNCSAVHVIGTTAHIDTSKKHRPKLAQLMAAAGWRLTYEKDGVHLDDYVGFRMVFRLNA